MSRFSLDTGTASDYANRRHGVYERARQEAARGHKIGIAIPALGELHYGVEFSAIRERNRRNPRKMLVNLTVWPFTVEAA
jgi:tRNA(fMet)-specific endonuclease VapC